VFRGKVNTKGRLKKDPASIKTPEELSWFTETYVTVSLSWDRGVFILRNNKDHRFWTKEIDRAVFCALPKTREVELGILVVNRGALRRTQIAVLENLTLDGKPQVSTF
jgi:hypothetical protein